LRAAIPPNDACIFCDNGLWAEWRTVLPYYVEDCRLGLFVGYSHRHCVRTATTRIDKGDV